ncbi:hypothetical protein [Candidatus Electronema sp. JM]|uniref:hypothetical protein n=1 Tax=Candidatus Electronema sp. JM TaxID=3401571 RepID=UPI003AA834FA
MNNLAFLSGKRFGFVAASLFSIVFLSGCVEPQTISNYDQETDISVTSLQKITEAHLLSLDTVSGDAQKCKYENENYKKFYEEMKIDVSSISLRADAIPNDNTRTKKQIDLLRNSLGDLEKLHKLSCLSPEQIKIARSNLESSFKAVLKLELAKKRG